MNIIIVLSLLLHYFCHLHSKSLCWAFSPPQCFPQRCTAGTSAKASSSTTQQQQRRHVPGNSVLATITTFCSSAYLSNRQRHLFRLKSWDISLRANAKEDEIAELEERLRKLKEEAAAATAATNRSSDIPMDRSPTTTDQQQTDQLSRLSAVQEPLEEMLSESWKDKEAADQNGVIRNLIVSIIVVIAAIAFSQIPVGQEGLDKYSTAKPSTTIDLGDLNPVKSSSSSSSIF